MTVYLKSCLIVLLVVAVSSLRVPAADDFSDVPLRMANGTVIEGTMQEATPDGLVIQGEKGKYTAPWPWKYLSAGTRYRYEIPMLVAQEIARSNALKKAAAEAAKKEAAAAKVAAKAAVKAAATNVTGADAVGVVSNMPPAKKKK